MKTKFYFLLIGALFSFATINAQVYVGGSLGFDYSSSSVKNGGTKTKGPNSLGIGVIPKVGFGVSDDVVFGAYGGLAYGRVKTPAAGFTPESKVSATLFEFGAFGRYYIINGDKFGLFAEMDAGISTGKSKSKAGGTTTDGPKMFMFDVNIAPVIEFKISESVSLETKLNLAGVGFSTATMKMNGIKNKLSSFYFGMESMQDFDNARLTDQALQSVYGGSGLNVFSSYQPAITMGLMFSF